jgi:uncharacterized protein (DUF58 family)
MAMEAGELIKKVRSIEITSRGLSNQIFAGQYHSAFKGKGMTFSEVREYQYGDDIRSIDWNVTARFNHPYVKIFEEERELTVMLVIDVSRSNLFGTHQQLKRDQITLIAAVLAFSAIQNNDKVGLLFFSDQIEKFIPPKKGASHILRIIRELLTFQPIHQKTKLSPPLIFLTNAIKKRCTAFIISDFIDNGYEDPLKIASHKHDLVGIRVTDVREKELPSVGLIRMRDQETGLDVLVDSSSREVRETYKYRWNTFESRTKELFRKNGVDLEEIPTGADLIKHLKVLFQKRGARR